MKLITPSNGNTILSGVTYVNTGALPISVAEAQTWTKVSGQADEIEDLIKEVVDVAENEFKFTIINKTVTAVYSDYGRYVRLPFAPIIEVTSAEVEGEAVEYSIIGDTLVFETFGGVLEVVYTTGGTLPEGVKLAVKKAVLSAFEDRQDTVLGGVGLIPNHSRAIFKRYVNY